MRQEKNFFEGEHRDCQNGTGDEIGIADGWVIYRLDDAVAVVYPLGRHVSYCRRGVPA